LIDTRRLVYFIQVSEDGSLSRAAESLHIAQPALTRQIQILEDYLGFALFTRTRRGMQLTREGELLRNAVVGPLREVELAVHNMRSFLSRVVVTIGIGLHPGLSPVIAKSLLYKIQTDFSNVKFQIYEGSSPSQIEWLKRGLIDFALTDQPLSDENCSSRLLASEDVVLVSAMGSEAVRTRPIGFNAMVKLPLILPPQHIGIRKILDAAAKQARASLNIRLETDSLPLVIELLKQDAGHALAAASLGKQLSDESDFLTTSIDRPSLKVGTHLITRSYDEIGLIARIDEAIEEVVTRHVLAAEI